ncbi:nuclear pore complex protein Nup214-like [Paramacrobiotus metropolitanus]|uniref:nuclear pore complex protein Nup214-like n=1 Tax=Paramacrobiotus metropolitanus TaxID=2943436 RepID=UPI0024456CBB|nr:nuclear pore complex protein Nup214-like [Paramacrobiotus metropolitanus]
METPPDPGDTKDFRFEKLREFTSWEADKETVVSRVIRGVTVANRFGLAFCICENGFYVINCTDFANLGKNGARLEDSGAFVVRLHGQPVLAAVSSTGLTLAVCFIDDGGLPVAFFYDIRAFSKKDAKVNPFHLIRLSITPAVALRDFSWIPTNEEIFAVVLSDGSLSLFEIKENATNVMGSLPPSGATCLSWSPKGKQFAVGRTDGSVAQYKPDLSLARSIPGPKISVSARNIVWLSTYVFAVAYVQPGNNQPILVILNAPKSGEPIFTNFDDVCMGSSDAKREPYYHLLPVFEWNMLLVASNTAMELAVLSCQSVDQTTGWLQLLLEETGRAEMPLVGSEENFPLGVSLLTCTPFPVIITATTLGVLVLYKIVNQMKTPTGMPLNICSKVELLGSIPGERRQLDIPQPQQRPPVITQATSVPEKKPIFAHPNLSESFSSVKSPLTLSTNQAAKPTLPSPVQPSVPLLVRLALDPCWTKTQKLTSRRLHLRRNQSIRLDQLVRNILRFFFAGMTAAHTTPKPVADPAKIPSGTVQQFLRNISALGKQIEGLSIEREPHKDAELSLHMENLSAAMDSLMSMFNETAIRLNEQEGLLEARLHVVEEALVIIEKCSDSHFLACFRDLPLDPLQQRKYNKLQSNLKEIETKLRSISLGIDFELDTMEAAAVNTEDQFADAKKTIKTIEVAALELQRKLFEIEKEAKKAGLHRRSVRPEVQVSPAEAISRLYPDLTKMASTKLSPAVSLRIRNNIRNSQPRTTKHEVILLRRHVAQEKTSSPTPKPSAKSSFKLDADFSGFNTKAAGDGSSKPIKTEAKNVGASMKTADQTFPEVPEQAVPSAVFSGASFTFGVDKSVGATKPAAATKTSEPKPSANREIETLKSTFGGTPSFGFGAHTSSNVAKTEPATKSTDQNLYQVVVKTPVRILLHERLRRLRLELPVRLLPNTFQCQWESRTAVIPALDLGLFLVVGLWHRQFQLRPVVVPQRKFPSQPNHCRIALPVNLLVLATLRPTVRPSEVHSAQSRALGRQPSLRVPTSTGFGSSFGGGTMTFGFPPPSSASPATTIPEPAKPLWPNAGSAAPSTGFTSFKVDTPAFGGGTVSSSSNPFATQAASSGFPTTGSGFGNFSSFGSKPASGTAGTAAPSGGFGSPFGGGTVTSTFPASNFPAATAAEPAKPMWGSTTTATQPSGFTSFKVDTPAFGGGGFGAPSNPFATQAAASGFPSAGFGASAFGQTPAFGGASGGFGASPSFGSSVQAPSGSAIWNTPGGFAAYASTPGLSFGSVAAQNNQPSGGFGAVTQQQPQQSGGFGFGGGNTGGAPQSNAFTQYR